ncbi:MAG TPA: hypothetical protein DHU72_03505 [Rikenellaceae bacterium]|nr:hypothetical protein [Rikenellaceae bacterium]
MEDRILLSASPFFVLYSVIWLLLSAYWFCRTEHSIAKTPGP